MDKLALLKKFAPKFINAEHLNKGARGITVDVWGNAYVTDGIQLLRLKEAYPEGSEGTFSLTGKRIDVERIKTERLVKDDVPLVAEVNVKDTLSAARHLRDVMKVSESSEVEAIDVLGMVGEFTLSIDRSDVQASYSVDAEDVEYFSKKVDINRLVSCLMAFESFTETLFIHTPSSGMLPMQFMSGDVTVLLMPIRVY